MLSSRCPGMLTTSSQDETMKIWDIMGGTPELVHESNLKIGTILCLDSAPDLAYIMASGGDYKTKNLVVFNAMTKANGDIRLIITFQFTIITLYELPIGDFSF